MDDKLTIVGPEPSAPNSNHRQRTVNIEALLLMAKYNDDFQQLLLNDRNKALVESGIDFSKEEKMLLKTVTDTQLKEHIEKFEVTGINKRSLKSWACAASIVILLSSLFIKCGDNPSNSDEDDDIGTLGNTADKAYVEKINSSSNPKDTFNTNNSSEYLKE